MSRTLLEMFGVPDPDARKSLSHSTRGSEAIFGPTEPGSRKALSYSQVNQLLTCGEQFRLERIERVQKRPNTAAVAGRIIHAATEAIDRWLFILTGHDGGSKNTSVVRDELYERWTEAANQEYTEAVGEFAGTEYADPRTWLSYGRPTEAKPHGEDLAWFVNVAIPDALESYIDWRLNGEWDILILPDGEPAIETPFQFELPSGLPVRGVIDRVFVSAKTGAPLIVDLKSGQKPKTDCQLALYRFALERLMPFRMFGWGAYVYGMKRGGQLQLTTPIDLSHWTVEKLDRQYSQVDRQIEERIFAANPGEACMHCAVSRHCDYYRASKLPGGNL